jgi:hypothetical protein
MHSRSKGPPSILRGFSMEFLGSVNSTWKFACRCAISDGVPRRSLYVALIVGTVLNLINQGDALLGLASINWLKLILTYCVPYVVCTYGAVSYQLKKAEVPLGRGA